MSWFTRLFMSKDRKIADWQVKLEFIRSKAIGAKGEELVKINAQIQAIENKIRKLQSKTSELSKPLTDKKV